MEFRISEQYVLEVHWKKAIYRQEGLAELKGCYLSGPALKEVEEINQEDHIDLEFSKQYIVFVPSYYIARLSWIGANQTPGMVYLDNVTLDNKYINSVPKLEDSDLIIIDTKNHENEKHEHHLTYLSYVLKFDGDLYKFRS